VLRRSVPLRGALTTCPGGGEVAVPQITFDLDSPDPIALATGTHTPYFARHDISLAKGERQGLANSALTRRYAVRCLLVLDAVIQRRRREIEVGFGNRPFEVTAGRCGPHAYSPFYDLDIDYGMVTRTYGSAC
jgi:hypothetical protein